VEKFRKYRFADVGKVSWEKKKHAQNRTGDLNMYIFPKRMIRLIGTEQLRYFVQAIDPPSSLT